MPPTHPTAVWGPLPAALHGQKEIQSSKSWGCEGLNQIPKSKAELCRACCLWSGLGRVSAPPTCSDSLFTRAPGRAVNGGPCPLSELGGQMVGSSITWAPCWPRLWAGLWPPDSCAGV